MASSKLVPSLDESFHEATSNVNQRVYICATCGKHLQSLSGLRRHMLAHGEKLYKCLICTKTFTEKHHYEGHINTHQNIKPFSCQNCKMKFSYKTSFNRHARLCQSKKTKEYNCVICQMKFERKDTLKDHINGKHASFGRYACEICGKRYKWRASRVNHMKSAHV